MSDLYGEVLLDHFRLPRHRGRLELPTISAEGINPLCGDELVLDLRFDKEKLTEIKFEGRGCAISQASASMLTELVSGMTVNELSSLISRVREFFKDGVEPNGVDLGDVAALAGVAKLPVRVKCAALPWTTLEEGLIRYRGT